MEHLSDYIENLPIFEQNQELGRCYYMSSKYTSLNGIWKFMWSNVPQNTPTEFFKPKFNDHPWDDIEMPSNWEMLGYGDKMFRNVSVPFHVNVPLVPSDCNPTGTYRREFQLPNNWNGHQVFL